MSSLLQRGRQICQCCKTFQVLARWGLTWNVSQLKLTGSRQFCQLGIHGTVHWIITSCWKYQCYPPNCTVSNHHPQEKGEVEACGFTHSVQMAWYHCLYSIHTENGYWYRLFWTIISRGKGRGGYHVVGCGRSNYGEKPHTHKVWTRRREKFFSIFSSWPKSPFWPFQNILIGATHTQGMNEAQRNLFKLAQMQRNLHYTQFKKMFWAWSYTQIQGKNEQQNLNWGQFEFF